jgi:murein DD-endopeptidase MepM/ murein hydrolase activator NlpD
MPSPRYTILIANRNTGAVRRLSVSRRLGLFALAGVIGVPGLMAIGAMGARGAGEIQVADLQATNETLRLENESYRAATGELAEQISSLQTALTELSQQAQLDPATKAAIDRLPAVVRTRATGGGATARPAANADTTLGILRDLLGTIESRLATVRTNIESRQALARATPSVWPVIGWFTSGYGTRKDPFNGSPDFHAGLDISADRGTPVWATADGTVESAGYNGNYGNSVLVTHGYGISTRFGHLSRYAVSAGQKVRRGQVIGYVGATGRATSSHLHYEILINGQPINPLRLLARP